MKPFVISVLMALNLLACASSQIDSGVSIEAYHDLVEHFSVHKKDYQGFYNTFQFEAALVNQQVREMQLQVLAQIKRWSPEKLREEKNKALRESSTETEVFLSFFTPDKKDNKFFGNSAVWSAVLEVGNEKYEGTVSKNSMPMADLELLYPFHNRWSTPYTVKFKVPISSIEHSPIKLIISGSLGNSENSFPAL